MITLNIANPNGENIKKDVNVVEMKLVDGNIAVLQGHTPFISYIENGYVKYEDKKIDINSGTVHFNDNNLYITYFD